MTICGISVGTGTGGDGFHTLFILLEREPGHCVRAVGRLLANGSSN